MRTGTVLAHRLCLESKLGIGGFGAVWSAEDLVSGAKVAVKISPLESLRTAWRRGLFDRETTVLRQLDHPGIVRWLDTFATDEAACLVMELAEGETLARLLGRRAATRQHLELDEISRMLGAMAQAVDYAHQRGVLHRDLKAPNVVCAPDGRIKLLDFGIAKLRDSAASEQTTQGRALGTLSQMAPEQILGKPVDERVDVYGLGCLAFELLTLRAPWVMGEAGLAMRDTRGILHVDPTRDTDMLCRIARGPRPAIAPYRSDVSAELDRLVQSAMAIDPADRPPSARAFGEALVALVQRIPAVVRCAPPAWIETLDVVVEEDIDPASLMSETPHQIIPAVIVEPAHTPARTKVLAFAPPPEPQVTVADAGGRFAYEVSALLDRWVGVKVDGVAELLSFAPDADVPDRWRLAFEPIEGVTLEHVLAQHLRGGRRMGPDRVIELVDKMAAPIEALHARGLVHGAIELGHARLTREDRVVWLEAGWRDALGLHGSEPDVLTDVRALAACFERLATVAAPKSEIAAATAILGPVRDGTITTVAKLRAHLASAWALVPAALTPPPLPEASDSVVIPPSSRAVTIQATPVPSLRATPAVSRGAMMSWSSVTALPPPALRRMSLSGSPTSSQSMPQVRRPTPVPRARRALWPTAATGAVMCTMLATQTAEPWMMAPLLAAVGLVYAARRAFARPQPFDRLRAALDRVPSTSWRELSRTEDALVLAGTRMDVTSDVPLELVLVLTGSTGDLRAELEIRLRDPIPADSVVTLRSSVDDSALCGAALNHLERHRVSRLRIEAGWAMAAFDVRGSDPERAGADAATSVSALLDVIAELR